MLTPLDIQNKIFKKSVRGYSMQQVDEFLNLVIASYESLYKENRELSDKIKSLNDVISHYKALEDTLQSTLIAAQTASDQIQHNAAERADNIIKSAQNRSVEIVNDAHQQLHKLKYDYEEMKNSMDIYRSRMISLLDSQLNILKEVTISGKVPGREAVKAQDTIPAGLSEEFLAALHTEEK